MKRASVLAAILVSGLFLQSHAEGPPPTPTVESLIERLNSPAPELQVYAAKRLATFKAAAAPAIPRLIELLPSIKKVELKHEVEAGVFVTETTTPRDEAMRTLAAIGAPAVQTLAEVASKNDGRMRALAVAEGVQTDGVGWQRMAVTILGQIGAPAVDALLAILKDRGTYHEYVRGEAADALARIRAPQTLAPLLVALDDEDDSVRGHAAIALGAFNDASAVEPLFNVVIKKRGRYLPGGWTEERVRESLARITGKEWQDFDLSYEKWRDWWRKNHP